MRVAVCEQLGDRREGGRERGREGERESWKGEVEARGGKGEVEGRGGRERWKGEGKGRGPAGTGIFPDKKSTRADRRPALSQAPTPKP